jgi:hypothetical protein
MFVSCECCGLSGRGLLCQADHLSRGVLLSVMCPMSVIVKPCKGRPWARNGLKCHIKKNSTWPPNWAEGKKTLSFTTSNIATTDYSVLSLMINENIGTIYSVDCKHFSFIWPLCSHGFSLLVQQCPAPKVKNWSSSSSFPLKYETVPKLWKFPFVFEAERTKCRNKDHPYLRKGPV